MPFPNTFASLASPVSMQKLDQNFNQLDPSKIPSIAIDPGTMMVMQKSLVFGSVTMGSVKSFVLNGLTSDAVTEGTTNLYFSGSRSISSALTGIVFSDSTPITEIDSVLSGMGKLQAQITSVAPGASNPSVPVRQTVLGGPVDSSGNPTFLPSTSATLSITTQNISSATPFVATSSNGVGSTGAVSRVGYSSTNLSWSGLTASTTNFLFVDIAANGSMTTGSTVLAPIYQYGGARSTTSGQATFNIQEMSMTVGNGSAAVQTWRVFVGEAVTGTSTVISTVAYAYQGKFQSSLFAVPAVQTPLVVSHNIGITPTKSRIVLQAINADGGYAVGDEVDISAFVSNGTPFYRLWVDSASRLAHSLIANNSPAYLWNKSSGLSATITYSNWRVKFYSERGW